MADPDKKQPRYMAQLLEELGWNQGTRIPLANPVNQNLETILIDRQNEIQRLKETLILQTQKGADLDKYKNHVQTEYQENTRLLFAHKQQLEQEVKLRQLSSNEAEFLERDIYDCSKRTNSIVTRVDRLQGSIASLLKKADSLKGEVCGEKGALQEWRAALERNAGDISSIEQFTKQDLSKAKALELKRQKLKLEHDQMQERLHQLISNLSAEERACERISVQVVDGMDQRKQMMAMWTGAIENLRQRDNEIRHIREDYAVLEEEANKLAEQCREQQTFCDQQSGNNADAERANVELAQQLASVRLAYRDLLAHNASADSEAQSYQRELCNMRITVEKLNMENRQLMETQHRKDIALQQLNSKIKELKETLAQSTDKSRSSDKRAKELEELLNDEENYASQLTVNQQRAQYCSFNEQQKLLALKNEEKLFHMQLKASKAIMSKLDSKQKGIENNLQAQKETLYTICYQVETIGVRVLQMEGARSEKECSAELIVKENRLKEVCARHAARVAMLERHSGKLHDDMRRLTRDLEAKGAEHKNLQSRLKTAMLEVEGGEKEVRSLRTEWRQARVEEALLRLRAEHAARALANLGRAAHLRDTRRLQIDAAMSERLVEIAARKDMFSVQKRALFEDCGKLRIEIRERQQRIGQLVKRYDILIASLGKDETGQQVSVTFFKIKFAADRAEMRSRGAALDAQITRLERDVCALEHALRVLHAAHQHFLRHLAPLPDDTPEIEELNELTNLYYAKRDELKGLGAQISILEENVSEYNSHLTLIGDKYKSLSAREAECENDLEASKERMEQQANRLQNAKDVARHNAKRAKKIIGGGEDWKIFQMSLWVRDYWEAWQSALRALGAVVEPHPVVFEQAAAMLGAGPPAPDRRLQGLKERFISGARTVAAKRQSYIETDESVFSSSSGSSRSGSVESGFTKRLVGFRKSLAPKVQEKALLDDIRGEAKRESVSLRVVTLGLDG